MTPQGIHRTNVLTVKVRYTITLGKIKTPLHGKAVFLYTSVLLSSPYIAGIPAWIRILLVFQLTPVPAAYSPTLSYNTPPVTLPLYYTVTGVSSSEVRNRSKSLGEKPICKFSCKLKSKEAGRPKDTLACVLNAKYCLIMPILKMATKVHEASPTLYL